MSKEKEHEFPQINHESIMNLSVDIVTIKNDYTPKHALRGVSRFNENLFYCVLFMKYCRV